jgi:hypothetical protein
MIEISPGLIGVFFVGTIEPPCPVVPAPNGHRLLNSTKQVLVWIQPYRRLERGAFSIILTKEKGPHRAVKYWPEIGCAMLNHFVCGYLWIQ